MTTFCHPGICHFKHDKLWDTGIWFKTTTGFTHLILGVNLKRMKYLSIITTFYSDLNSISLLLFLHMDFSFGVPSPFYLLPGG